MAEMIKQRKRGRPCPRCGLPELGLHKIACARRHAEFDPLAGLAPEDLRAVVRAAAHAVHEEVLEPAVRFMGGVTDLDVARLLRALEAGTEVVQGGRSGWTVPTGSPLKRGLSQTVAEAIRLELVRAVTNWVTDSIAHVEIVPAPVHIRSRWDNLRPRCEDDLDAWRAPKRYRLVDEAAHADCQACISRAY